MTIGVLGFDRLQEIFFDLFEIDLEREIEQALLVIFYAEVLHSTIIVCDPIQTS